MRRIIIVYNPTASQAERVAREVLRKKIPGFVVGKVKISGKGFDENVENLAELIVDEDLVVAVGGDGTASVVVNAVMRCMARNVVVAALPYGNFNDMARKYGTRSIEEVVEKYSRGEIIFSRPLEVFINGGHFRYAECYCSVGMMAEATKVFDEPEVRERITKKKGIFRWLSSIFTLAGWYFRNKKRRFVAEKRYSDYLFTNGGKVAATMKSGEEQNEKFLSYQGELNKFFRLMGFMIKSILHKIPGEYSRGEIIKFGEPREVAVQVEGECVKLGEVKEIAVRKAGKRIRVVG